MRHWDSENDKSTCRKYRVDVDALEICILCDCCPALPGYIFEIYDWVIDVPNPDPKEPPIVADNRLITSVFVCDSCYKSKTEPNK